MSARQPGAAGSLAGLRACCGPVCASPSSPVVPLRSPWLPRLRKAAALEKSVQPKTTFPRIALGRNAAALGLAFNVLIGRGAGDCLPRVRVPIIMGNADPAERPPRPIPGKVSVACVLAGSANPPSSKPDALGVGSARNRRGPWVMFPAPRSNPRISGATPAQ